MFCKIKFTFHELEKMCCLISDYSRTLKSQYMLDYLGMYSCEFRVTLASGQILKFSDIRLFIFSKFSVAKELIESRW